MVAQLVNFFWLPYKKETVLRQWWWHNRRTFLEWLPYKREPFWHEWCLKHWWSVSGYLTTSFGLAIIRVSDWATSLMWHKLWTSGYLTRKRRWDISAPDCATKSVNFFWFSCKKETVWHKRWTSSGYLTRKRRGGVSDGGTIRELLLVTLQERDGVASVMVVQSVNFFCCGYLTRERQGGVSVVVQSVNFFWLPYKRETGWCQWW